MPVAPPRLFGIPALEAPVVAVVRRGPSAWTSVGRWDVSAMTYEQGSWLRGTIYAQRSDLSPDGRWLCYLGLKGSARWSLGATYLAVSRLPWLTALAAWSTCGTWTHGLHFDRDPSVWRVTDPDEGELGALRGRVGLAVTAPASFAVERRRGWREADGVPPRKAGDMWDERRLAELRLEKPRPGDPETRLEVRGAYAAFRSAAPTHAVAYRILAAGEETALRGVQWADWAADSRLLVATRAGELQAREPDDWRTPAAVAADLSRLTPAPTPPPAEARRW
jgi:hypothetical protein